MKKQAFVIALILILSAIFILPAFAQAPAGPKIVRWASSIPPKRGLAVGWEWMGTEFEKATNGRYKVEYYFGETLFKQASSYDSVLAGVTHISEISIGTFEKRLPLSQIAILPTLDFPSTVKGRIAAGKAFLDMYNTISQVQEELKGIKIFGYHQLFPYILASKKKEISLPEHFKGLKVGGSGSKMKLVFNNGGAEVTQMPPDAYMNMDKGVVDACYIAWSQISLYKLWETAKYFYDFGFGGGAFAMSMNTDFWKGMSPEDQKIFLDLWEKAFIKSIESNYVEVEKGKKATAEAATVRSPTKEETIAWKKAAAPVIEQCIKAAKASNANDPEMILDEWQKRIEAHKE